MENCLGYNKWQEIPFQEMLNSRSFYENIPTNLAINQKISPKTALEKIVQELEKVKVLSSASIQEIKFGNEQSIITGFFKEFLKNWQKFPVKHILNEYCNLLSLDVPCNNSENLNYYDKFSADKCSFTKTFLLEQLSSAMILHKLPIHCQTKSMPVSCYELNLLKSEFQNNKSSNGSPVFDYAIEWKKVYQFLLSAIHHVIPYEIFGSERNLIGFRQSVKKLLMMGRHDKFFLEYLMMNVKLSDCKWANNLQNFYLKSNAVAKVWVWLLRYFIIPLLSSFFLITESSHRQYQLFFFRKKHWQKLYNLAYTKLLNTNTLRILTQKQVQEFAKVTLCNGSQIVSKPPSLRFIPKPDGMRPILSVKSGSLKKTEVLKAKLLLNHITSSFFHGIKEIRSHKAFQKVWTKYAEKLKLLNDFPIYGIKVDIQNAFGTMKHEVFKKIFDKALKELNTILYFKKHNIISSTSSSNSSVKYLEVDKMGHLVSSEFCNETLVNGGYTLQVNVKDTICDVLKLICGQIIRVGKNSRLLILQGIAQGSTLSSELYELYISAMCHKYLLIFNNDNSILLRSVDDFLYITPSRELAIYYMKIMNEGFPEFNSFINSSKTQHNINGDDQRIIFRGVIFCTATKQLLISVNQLSTSLSRYSIRFNQHGNPGKLVLLRLNQITKARLPVLLYDPSYTSVESLVANIWRCALSVGGRIGSLIKFLLIPNKNFNCTFLTKGLKDIAGKVWSKVKGIWNQYGRTIPFSKSFVIVLYLGGILAMLEQRQLLHLVKLRKSIKRVIKIKGNNVSACQINLLSSKLNRLCKLSVHEESV